MLTLTEQAQAAPATPSPAWQPIYDFLRLVVGETGHILFRPIETWTERCKKRSRVVYPAIRYAPATPLTIKMAVSALAKCAATKRANIFFGVCPRHGSDGRYDKAWQIRRACCLWADVDHTLPAAAVQRCVAAGLPSPSIVVSSGSGAHVYWLLDVPYLVDDAPDPAPVFAEWVDGGKEKKKKRREFIKESDTGEKLYLDDRRNIPPLSDKAQWLQDVIQGIAAAIGGDATHDLSRLLRVPGTLNRKDERNGRAPLPCEIVELDASRRYPIGDFGRFADHSPDRERRAKLATVPLPACKRITPARRDKINDLVTASALAPVGQRSQRDFDLCCFAIRQGFGQADVWPIVSGVGKFAEGGQAYFLRTWTAAEQEARERIYEKCERKHARKKPSANGNGHAKATAGGAHPQAAGGGDADDDAATDDDADQDTDAPALANYVSEIDDDGKPQKRPLPMARVLTDLLDATGGWPRRVGAALFVDEGRIAWLDSPAALFGWLAGRLGIVDWARGSNYVGKEEAFCELKRTAIEYIAIETLPHFATMAGHYYACPVPEPGDGAALNHLLDQFTPSTPIDRDLILAAFATLFWGGAGGSRPAFVITSDAGRGVGKSMLVALAALLVGGFLDFSQKDDIAAIKTRLLGAEGLKRRIALLDNVKSLRLSWAELEALLTATEISGHRMYEGEARRPNTLTWFVTLNGASLSTDVAQRAVVIKLNAPKRTGEWEETTKEFVSQNRDAIIADLAAFLQGAPSPPRQFSRWASWEKDVLSRLAEPEEAQRVIIERQGEADVEREEADVITDFFFDQLKSLGYEPDASRVFLPSEIAAQWLNRATNVSHSVTGASRVLRQFHSEGGLPRIKPNLCKTYGRGFEWSGADADFKATIWTNIRERIAIERAAGRASP